MYFIISQISNEIKKKRKTILNFAKHHQFEHLEIFISSRKNYEKSSIYTGWWAFGKYSHHFLS